MRVQRGVLIVGLSLALITLPVSWTFAYDDDELQVFRAAIERVHGSDGVVRYVLRSNTGPCTPFGMTAFHRRKLGVPFSTSCGYWMKNLVCRTLPRSIPLEYPYILASQKELEPVFASSTPDANTTRLQQEIVRGYGVVGLSRAGFNLLHTRAVIYVELLYCGLCGGGQYYYLTREDGVWRVKDVAGTWIS